jgi:putative endonuclease
MLTLPLAVVGLALVGSFYSRTTQMDRTYCVYILASRSRALYTGVTNHLRRRIQQHREGVVRGFTSQYRIHRLVHYQVYADIRAAIRREKEIKGWRREKKVALIEETNPTWEDLAEKTGPISVGDRGKKE